MGRVSGSSDSRGAMFALFHSRCLLTAHHARLADNHWDNIDECANVGNPIR